MSITPDEMVSPEAHRAVCEERDELAARVAELEARLGGAQTEAQRYLELASRLERERDMARFDLEITFEELVDTREERDAERLARVTESDRADGLEEMLTVVEVWRDELEGRVHDLERDRDQAVELARRWRERCAAKAPPADPVLAQLLEQARRGAVPCGLYLRDWQRLEGVGLVEWRDGAYWRVEVDRGG
jgi:hypothetical protein